MPTGTPYSNKLHGVLKEAYGEKFVLTEDQFFDKMTNEPAYQEKIYGVLQDAYGKDFTLTPKQFYDKLKKKEPATENLQIPSQLGGKAFTLSSEEIEPPKKRPYQDISYKKEPLQADVISTQVPKPIQKAVTTSGKVSPAASNPRIIEDNAFKASVLQSTADPVQKDLFNYDMYADEYDRLEKVNGSSEKQVIDNIRKYDPELWQELSQGITDKMVGNGGLGENLSIDDFRTASKAIYQRYNALLDGTKKNLSENNVKANKAIDEIVKNKINEKTFEEYTKADVNYKNVETAVIDGRSVSVPKAVTSGQKVIDVDKLNQLATEIVDSYNLKDDGKAWQLVFNKLKSQADYEIDRGRANQILAEKYPESAQNLERIKTESAKIAGMTPEQFSEYWTDDDAILARYDSLAKSASDQALKDAEMEAAVFGNDYTYNHKRIESEYQNKQKELSAQANAIEDMKRLGNIDDLTYKQAVSAIEGQLEEAYNKYEKDFQGLDQYVKSANEVYSRYNRKLKTELEGIQEKADSEITGAFNKYIAMFEDPAVLSKIQSDYSKAHKEASIERADAMGEAAYENNALSYFLRSTKQALGGVISGYGGYFDSKLLKVLGETVAQNNKIDQAKAENFSDLLDAKNLLNLTGQLGGSMAPGMVATATVAAATGGAGVPTIVPMIAGGVTGWLTESMDIAGRAYNDMFEKTNGDVEKASEAFRKAFNSQYDLMGTYAFSALPFVGGALSKISSKTGRILTGAAIEYGEEYIQEFNQNIAEENISEGLDAWEGYSQKILDPKRHKENAITLAPTLVLGGLGQVRSKSPGQQAADAYMAIDQKTKINPAFKDQERQYIQSVVFERNAEFAKSMISTLFTAGKINEDKATDMLIEVERAQRIKDSADAAKLKGDNRIVYSFFASRAEDAERSAKIFHNDPIMSKVFEQQAKDYQQAGIDFINGKTPELYSITFADGSQNLMTQADMADIMQNENALDMISDGNVQISSYGSKTGSNSLETLREKVAQYEENKRVTEEKKVYGEAYNNTIDVLNAIKNNEEYKDKITSHPNWSTLTVEEQDEVMLLTERLSKFEREKAATDAVGVESVNLDEKIKTAKQDLSNLLNREPNDNKNVPGVSSEIGEGKKPIEEEPVEGTGTETAEAGGVLQAPEEEVTPEMLAQELNQQAGIDLFVARKPIETKGENFVLSQIKENNNDNTFIVEDESGNEVGRAQLSADGNYVENVRIDEEHRRKGLASSIYDFIEERKGIELQPSPIKQSKEAKALWDKRTALATEAAPEVTVENEVETTAKALEGAYQDKDKFGVLKHLTGALRSNLVDIEYLLADEESVENAEVYGKIKEIGNSITEDMEAMEKDGFSGSFDEVRQQFEDRFNEAKTLVETLPKYKEVKDLLSQFDNVSNESVSNWIKTNSAYKSGKYYEAKKSGSNPQLVKEVEGLIGKPTTEAAPEVTSEATPESTDKAQIAPVGEAVKVLENAAPDYTYNYGKNRQERYAAFRRAGLAWHGGESVIKKFDKDKIKGGFRGELGYGYYFGASSKPLDYGSAVTFIDLNGLNLLDGERPLTEDIKSKLKEYIDSKRDSSSIRDMQKSLYAEKLIKYGESSVRDATNRINGEFTGDASPLFSELMTEIGYDGMQVSDNWQLVLYPQDKLNDVLVDNPNKFTIEQYVQAKVDGSNPGLVEAVENVIGKPTTEAAPESAPVAEEPAKPKGKKKAEPKAEKPKRQQVEESLKKLRDQGLLVTADTSLLAKAKKLVGKKPKPVPMSDKEIAAQMKLLDAMAKVWKNVSGQDTFYDEFINEVKKGDLKKLQDLGGVLYQEEGDEKLAMPFKARVTLGIFNLPQFKLMEGKMVAAQNVKDMVKTKAKPRGEKPVLEMVLDSPKYKDQKRFSFDEFKTDVEIAVMNFEKHYTSSYANYGMDNLGSKDIYGTSKTIVFNAPVSHGYSGHWNNIYDPAAFSARNWVLREVPERPGLYVAWDNWAPSGIGEDQLMNYVGTAGTRDHVEKWITDIKNIGNDRNKLKVGLFGHIRAWQEGDKFYVAELQSDTHQKYQKAMNRPLNEEAFVRDPGQQAVADYVRNEFLPTVLTENQKHLPVYDEMLKEGGVEIVENDLGDRWYALKVPTTDGTRMIPLASIEELNRLAEDAVNNLLARPNFERDYADVDRYGPLRDMVHQSAIGTMISDGSFLVKPQELDGPDYRYGAFMFMAADIPSANNINYQDYAQSTVIKFVNQEQFDTFNKALEKLITATDQIRYSLIRVVGDVKDVTNTRKFKENVRKFELAILKSMGGMNYEKQFLDLDKNYMTRLVRESIRLAAEAGAKTMLIPSPLTLAKIEGYSTPSANNDQTDRMIPYETPDGTDADLVVGDVIKIADTEYIVLEANATDIKVAEQDKVFTRDVYEYANEMAWNDVSEIEYELRRALKNAGREYNSKRITQEDIDAIEGYEFDFYSGLQTLMQNELDRTSRRFELLEEYEQVEPESIPYITWDDVTDDVAQELTDNNMTMDASDLFGTEVFETNRSGEYYSLEWNAEVFEYRQPDQYDEKPVVVDEQGQIDREKSFEESFRDDLPAEQATVVQKYINLRDDFKKLRPDTKPFIDENRNVWYETQITPEDLDNPIIAFQKEGEKAKAAIDFTIDQKATVHIFKGADISSLAHEMTGHIGRRVLERLAAQNADFAKDYEAAKKWSGVDGDFWNTAAEEKFARGFERYLRSGKAPNKSLQSVFNKLREWFSNIYEQIKGGSIDVNITPRMKKVFDNLLAYKPEPKTETKTKKETKTEEVKRKPKQEILDKAKRLADLYREIKSGNVSVRPELDDLLDNNPKLKYLYKNLPSINAKLEKDGLITKKTDGCP